jgi:hypothetical protein
MNWENKKNNSKEEILAENIYKLDYPDTLRYRDTNDILGIIRRRDNFQ